MWTFTRENNLSDRPDGRPGRPWRCGGAHNCAGWRWNNTHIHNNQPLSTFKLQNHPSPFTLGMGMFGHSSSLTITKIAMCANRCRSMLISVKRSTIANLPVDTTAHNHVGDSVRVEDVWGDTTKAERPKLGIQLDAVRAAHVCIVTDIIRLSLGPAAVWVNNVDKYPARD